MITRKNSTLVEAARGARPKEPEGGNGRPVEKGDEHEHRHEWVVFSTALAEGWLMVQCVECGMHGTVEDPTKQEWAEAFYAPSNPYRWCDGSRVMEKAIGPFYVTRNAANGGLRRRTGQS